MTYVVQFVFLFYVCGVATERIQPLPVCAGFFICIRNSLDRPYVTMPLDHLLANVK